MIHFMIQESEKPTMNQLHSMRGRSPDDVYYTDNSSITFIYDQHNRKLYHANYPISHGEMLMQGGVAKKLDIRPEPGESSVDRTEALRDGYILGRIGKQGEYRFSNDDSKQFPVISFWGNRGEINQKDLNNALEDIVKEFPYLAKEKENVIVTSEAAFPPFFLADAKIDFPSGEGSEAPKEKISDPECTANSQITVDGQPMSLGNFVGNLHNVRGERLQKMHAAFCGAEKNLKNSLKDKCPHEVELLNHVSKRFGQLKMICNDDWNRVKTAGKSSYRNDLRNVFDKAREAPDEDYLGQQFRTQREIDAAWDAIRKEHRIPSFLEWLKGTRR
jgi:hypothetical protein